ncbi:hypothetical protein AMTRI_Chr01g126340 [Amborella trichopoda]
MLRPIFREAHYSPYFLSLLLDKCSCMTHLNQAHAFMIPRGLDHDNLSVSKFISTCSLLGYLNHGYTLFSLKKDPNIYLYNTMIRAFSQSHSAKESIVLFDRIRLMGFSPDTYSFPFVLKACAHLSAIKEGREIHAQVIRVGFGSDVHVQTGLIHMYSNCSVLLDARRLFDEMSHRDLISWNAMIAGYAKLGDIDTAHEIFEQMDERNVISWTAVISGYAQMNRSNEAISLFRRMQLSNVKPDEISMLSVLSACAQMGALDLGQWIHNYIDKHRLYRIVPLINALIDMYAKSGHIDKALEVFEKMPQRSVITWTTMIAGLAFHGLGEEALTMFSQMEQVGLVPSDVTFIALLSACCHMGMVEAGWGYFHKMISKYGISPKIEHYGCMVDLLGRAGRLKEARELVREMPYEANGAIWGALLSASRVHNDVELGELALKHLIEVEPHNSGNYILLSNIYASLGRWDEVGKVRRLMRDRGVKKMPGGSSIEVNGIVHEFVVGDDSHPNTKDLFELLAEINGQLKMAGYIP